MTSFASSFGSAGASSLGVAATGTTTAGYHNPNNDKLVNQPPNDTVSSIAFSPKALAPNNFLVAGSWDNEVRLWQIQSSGDTSPIGMIQHEAPVLDVAWSADGMTIFSVGCERIGKMWNPATNQVGMCVATAKQLVKCV
jgi:mRNA export factor